MVSDDLLRGVLWLYGHGQIVAAYRPDTVLAQGLAGYFAVIIIVRFYNRTSASIKTEAIPGFTEKKSKNTINEQEIITKCRQKW